MRNKNGRSEKTLRREQNIGSQAKTVTLSSLTEGFDGLVQQLQAEAAAAAIKLGFRPGPKLRQAVRDEAVWWEEIAGYDDDQGCGYDGRVTSDPVQARVCAIEAIDALLGPYETLKDGPIEPQAEILDLFLASLRRALPHADTRVPPGMTAEWSRQQRAAERVYDLKRQIEEAEKEIHAGARLS